MLHRLGLQHVLSSILIWSTLITAWPWPPSPQGIEALILRRADSTDGKGSSVSSSSVEPTKTSKTQKSASVTASETNDKKTKNADSSKTAADSSKTTSIDDQSPAGVVAMITPAPLDPAVYYKIGDPITFVWNYSSLLADPKAIDVLVTCSTNHATYTVTNNATFEPTATITWDTKGYTSGSTPLLTEQYGLVIYDAAQDVSGVPNPGHLGTFNQFHFAMYSPKPYVPRDKWVCTTCSGALSDKERQTLSILFATCIITVISFTWFAGSFGILF